MTGTGGAPGTISRDAGGPGAAARRRGGDAQQRLVAAATEVIAERGWLGVTTRRVAARAGVNPALVHYHFGSVEALRRRAAEQAAQNAVNGPLGRLLTADDLPGGLAGALRAIGELDRDDPQMRVLLEASLYATHDPDLGRVMAGMLAQFRAVLAARIERSVEQGHMPPADPQATATLLAALVDGMGLHWLLSPGLDLAAAGAALQTLLTAGTATEGAS